MTQDSLIKEELYQQIRDIMPIACVDIVPIYHSKFLLAKRINIPEKETWYVPGGRILIGESFLSSAKRKMLEEIGLSVKLESLTYLTTQETIFNLHNGTKHTINIVYKCSIKEEPLIRLDTSQFSDFNWFEKIDATWPEYIKKILLLSGFEKN